MYHSYCKVANKSLNLLPKVKTFHNPTFPNFLYSSLYLSKNKNEKTHMVSTHMDSNILMFHDIE